jgi:probable glycosyl transferase, family 2
LIKISVLMTVYNAENMLHKSIEGILKQTYPNMEFVIVNDGSRDSSAQIIQQYAEQDTRVVFVNRSENKGRNYSLNEGLSHCTGEWIAINDADDVSVENRLERMYEFITSNQLEDCFGVVGSAYKTINTQDGTVERYKLKYGRPGKKRVANMRIFYSMPFAHSTFIYRTKVLNEIGGFPTEVTAWIDFFALTKIACKYPIYALNECLVDRYIDGNNFFLKKKITDQQAKNEAVINAWKKDNFPAYGLCHFLGKCFGCVKRIIKHEKSNG